MYAIERLRCTMPVILGEGEIFHQATLTLGRVACLFGSRDIYQGVCSTADAVLLARRSVLVPKLHEGSLRNEHHVRGRG